MTKTVAIIGAGPSGILLAHYLLRRGDRYRVDLILLTNLTNTSIALAKLKNFMSQNDLN